MKKAKLIILIIIILSLICIVLRLFTPLFGPPVYVYMFSCPFGPSQYGTLPNGIKFYKADELISVSIHNDDEASRVKYCKNIKWVTCLNRIDDLSFIGDVEIERLSLSYPCSDYSHLGHVNSLRFLQLEQSSLKNADELPVIDNLEKLQIFKKGSFDCEGIGKFRKLKTVEVIADNIDNIRYLGDIQSLEFVMLHGNSKDYDVKELAQIKQVNTLVLRGISDEEKRQEILDAFAGSDVNVIFD